MSNTTVPISEWCKEIRVALARKEMNLQSVADEIGYSYTTISGSAQLKKCPANSIIGAAFVAATYDLPIDSNLGFAAIVPYNESVWNPRKKDWEKVPKAQFQMMYKGFIASFLEVELELQLNNKTCIRPINQGIEFVGYRVWPDKVVLRKKTTLHIKRVLKAKKEAYRVKEISFKQATDTLQSYLGMMKYCDCDALKEKILNDFVLTHADMKQIYEEGGDRDENYYRRGDGWSVEDYPVTDETHRPAGTCIAAAWNY